MSHRTFLAFFGRLAAKPRGVLVAASLCLFLQPSWTRGQPPRPLPLPPLDTPAARAKADSYIQDILLPEVTLQVDPRHSKLIRTRKPVSRFSITNPDTLEVVQFSPTEFELIGLKMGQTTLTLWFGDQEVLRYLVKVSRDTEVEDKRESEYRDLQNMVNEMFPNSSIQLIPATAIAILAANKSANPTAIVGTSIMATTCAAVSAVVMAKFLERLPIYRLPKADVVPANRAPEPGETAAGSQKQASVKEATTLQPLAWWGILILFAFLLFF